jgi:hypothetical protein
MDAFSEGSPSQLAVGETKLTMARCISTLAHHDDGECNSFSPGRRHDTRSEPPNPSPCDGPPRDAPGWRDGSDWPQPDPQPPGADRGCEVTLGERSGERKGEYGATIGVRENRLGGCREQDLAEPNEGYMRQTETGMMT